MSKTGGSAYRNIVFISQLGISIMVPTFLCLFLGLFLDDKFGTWFTVPLLFLGLAAGLRNAYVLAKNSIDKEEEERRRAEQELIERVVREHGKKDGGAK